MPSDRMRFQKTLSKIKKKKKIHQIKIICFEVEFELFHKFKKILIEI